MAEQFVINNTSVKTRSPLGVLGLSIITFGIYGIYLWFANASEIKGYTNDQAGYGPASVFWVLVPIAGIFILLHKMFKAVDYTQQQAGLATRINIGLAWIISIFTGLGALYVQSELNKAWQSANAGGTGGLQAGAAQPELASTGS